MNHIKVLTYSLDSTVTNKHLKIIIGSLEPTIFNEKVEGLFYKIKQSNKLLKLLTTTKTST